MRQRRTEWRLKKNSDLQTILAKQRRNPRKPNGLDSLALPQQSYSIFPGEHEKMDTKTLHRPMRSRANATTTQIPASQQMPLLRLRRRNNPTCVALPRQAVVTTMENQHKSLRRMDDHDWNRSRSSLCNFTQIRRMAQEQTAHKNQETRSFQ